MATALEQDLTLGQLATVTQRHVESLRRLARAGRLQGVYKLGNRWMISRAAADSLRCLPRTGTV